MSTVDTQAAIAATGSRTVNFKDIDLDKMNFNQLVELSRATEARANVFRSRATFNDGMRPALDEALADAKLIADKLRDMGGDLSLLGRQDPEGTAPTYSDAHGSYAPDVETAQLGGVGINFSNTEPELAKQVMTGEVTTEDALEQAGPVVPIVAPVPPTEPPAEPAQEPYSETSTPV